MGCNAQRFQGQFEFTDITPNPASPLLANYNFYVDVNGLAKDVRFMLKDDGRDPRKLGRIYSLLDEELDLAADEFYNSEKKYCLFNWKNKHIGWLQSHAPVFLDFGHEFLYLLKKRDQLPTPLLYLQIVSKRDFLAKYTRV